MMASGGALTDKVSVTRQRLVRFALSGGWTALLFLALSYTFSHAGLEPFLGNVLAYSIAFLVGYALQRNWTFGAKHRHQRALPRYFLAQLACALFSGAAGHVLVSVLGAPLWMMSIITTALAGCASYLLSFFWVFSDDAQDSK